MSWVFFAIASSAVYATNNFIDKYVLERQIPDYRGLVVYTAIVGFIFGGLLWLIGGPHVLGVQDASLVMLTGMCTIWGLALYFRALSVEETSSVIILMQMVPVFTVILSAIFLGEWITIRQLAGFLLVLSAVVGVSHKKESIKMRPSAALFFMVMANLCWAVANVLFEFVSASAKFIELAAYESFGIAAGGLALFIFSPSVRAAFSNIRQFCGWVAIAFIVLNEILFLAAKLLAYYGIRLGPVSLVSILGSTQIFFGIIYGWLLTMVTDKTFNEDISVKGILKKICMAILILAGILLLQD